MWIIALIVLFIIVVTMMDRYEDEQLGDVDPWENHVEEKKEDPLGATELPFEETKSGEEEIEDDKKPKE